MDQIRLSYWNNIESIIRARIDAVRIEEASEEILSEEDEKEMPEDFWNLADE